MVSVVSSMPLLFMSLTTGGAAGAPLVVVVAPFPPSPWQAAQLSAKIGAPWSDVPLPAGKPAPLGSISISHGAISAGTIGLPRFRPSPNARPVPIARVHKPDNSRILCVRMRHRSLVVDRPAHDRVEMMILKCQERWY